MNDNSRKLNRILVVTGRPAYVKSAADKNEEQVPVGAYGDSINRQYPGHTKEAAFCSYVLALQDGAPVEVMERLTGVCRMWGIEQDVKTASEKLAAAQSDLAPESLPDSDFALVQDYKGQKVRKYAAVDSETTFEAAIAFHENRASYPLAWRKTAAQSLLDRAEKHQTLLPDYVNQYLHKAAGLAEATTESIDDALIARLNRTGKRDDDVSAKLAEALDALVTNPDLRQDPEVVNQALSTLDLYDRELKLAQFYGHGLDLPEEMLAVIRPKNMKVASARRIVRLVNGHDVDVSTLPADALEAVQDGMSKLGNAKLEEILPTLPKPDADLLIELLPKTAAAAMMAPSPIPNPTTAPAAAPAAGAVPPMGNSLTDDNFSQQAAAAAAMPAAPMDPQPAAPTAMAGGGFHNPAASAGATLLDKSMAQHPDPNVAHGTKR